MLAKSDYLWHFYSIPFFCKKWSKIMKNTLVFLKQPRMDTFSLSEAVKNFLVEKMKTTNRIATKSPSKFSHKATGIFSKCSHLTHFGDFQIFKTNFFLSFLVSHQKKIFF